ncbi:MAG: PstS family phosphate ABC transporter substrate-binding protein [Anaerolineales bacterium]
MNRKFQTLLALLVMSGVLLAACSPAAATSAPAQPTAASGEPTAAVDDPMAAFSPLNVSGDVITAGSSTVFPLTERMSERFRNEGFTGNITVDSIGSGAGYERFCVEGDSDISNASRAIRENEVSSCESIGRTPLEFRVGTDGLSVVVSTANDFVTDVTMEELQMIFSDAATNWSDIRAEWPDEPIQRFIPGTDSGTFDFFVEIVFDEDETGHLAAANTQLSEDDNVLVQGVLGSQYAVGYFGYAYYIENADTLNLVAIDGVLPTEATVELPEDDPGAYALARPLFIYSDASIMNSKPQVAAFIHFYLAYGAEEVVDVGYFPASQAASQRAWDNFNSAMGTDFSSN